jgi:hypothetical protein
MDSVTAPRRLPINAGGLPDHPKLLDYSVEDDGTVTLRISYRFSTKLDDEGQEATHPDIWLFADEAGADGESTLPL